MEFEEQRAGKVSVKESIRYVSNLITGLGVTGISPENLRLAKFNSLQSPRCLLQPLHNILTLVAKSSDPSLASSTTSCDFLREQLTPQTVLAALESACEASLDEDLLEVVKLYLALWRYPPDSPFFTLHADTDESRHFLLALGWILSRCNLIERALEHRLQPLLAARNAAPLPLDYPLDMSSCPEALATAKMAEWAALDYVRRMIAATDRVEDEILRTEMRAEQVLMLHGQVRACVNAIQELQKTKVKSMHELQLAQLVAGEKQPYTPYELHLLQHRKKLDLHCHAIAAARAIEDEKEVCRKHEDLFWQWMESVAHEALAVQAQSPLEQALASNLTCVTETELLPAVEHLKWESATFKPLESFKQNASILNSCPGGDSTLPQHAKDITKFLLRQPVFVCEPVKKPETRTVKATLRNEEDDPQSVSVRIQRVMEVDEMVKAILAKFHAENKNAILETLKPIMENKSFVVVGV